LILASSTVAVVAQPVSGEEKVKLCDVKDCPVCEVVDLDPRIPECPTDSGWLCCNNELTVCGPGSGDGSCPGIDYWCDYYETDESGFSVCWDEWGQG
jgi:hypothetical protein